MSNCCLFNCSHGVFNKPMSCPGGHSFCHQCITQWLANNTICPVDRAPCGSLVRNRAVEGAIAKKLMKCPSSTSHPGGCSWTGPTSSLQDHLPRCDMKVVECDFKYRGCIFRAYQREIAQHRLICPHRTVKCSCCVMEIPHGDLSAHDEICVGKMVPCPNNCGLMVERFMIRYFIVSFDVSSITFFQLLPFWVSIPSIEIYNFFYRGARCCLT